MTVDEELNQLEDNLRRLKIEYDIFFGGGSKRPPNDLDWRVQSAFKRHSDSQRLSFSQRFKFNSMQQKYAIYARDFDNAYVVIRPQIDWHPQSYADSTGIVVPLPSPMRPLLRDGTLGDAVSSVTLRNVEAAILFK